MLFRQRASFQGVLNLRRCSCGEMPAYNMTAKAYYRAQSLCQSSSLASGSPMPAVDHTSPPTSLHIHALSPPRDFRWKRGRPVSFSSHAFSTKPAESAPPAGDAAIRPETPDIQTQGQNQPELGTSLSHSASHSTGCASTMAHVHSAVHANRSPCAVPHGHPTATKVDCATTEGASSKGDCEVIALQAPSSDTHSARLGDKALEAPDTYFQAKLSLSEESTMDNATDPDFISSSTDESARKLEGDILEAGHVSEEAREEHTRLEFQIPEDILRTAMSAPGNTKASFWSSNLYRGPGGKRIAVHYCKTKEVAERVARHFVNEKVVGFDIEWKPWSAASSIKKNVSLIQLACEDRIALFHVALFSGTIAAQLMPPTLKAILESPDVYKVGVAIKGDFSRVSKYLEIEPQGIFEVSRLHNLVKWYTTDMSKITNKLVSLAAQVQEHLQLPLYKGGQLIDDPEDLSNVRSSDWSLPLNMQQIHYAAADAYAGFRLYDVLEEKRKHLKPVPPRPLVCDYDSRPAPRTSKLRKKRKTAPMTDVDEAAVATPEDMAASMEQEGEPEGDSGEDVKQTQETDGYETAQENLVDRHRLECNEPAFSQDVYKETYESEDNLLTNMAQSLNGKRNNAVTDAMQKHIGRIDFSRLKDRDMDYPTLPTFCGGEESESSSDEDVVATLTHFREENFESSSYPMEAPKQDEEANEEEFEDSELEEALQDLKIDSDGRLQEDTNHVSTSVPVAPFGNLTSPTEKNVGSGKVLAIEEPHAEGVQRVAEEDQADAVCDPETVEMQTSPKKPIKSTLPVAASTTAVSKDAEEHGFTELLNDPEVVKYLYIASCHPLSAEPASSPLPPHFPIDPPEEQAKQTTHTPEFDLATSWAQTYLASTIPSPGSHAPSHIRATIPHLRAYNMWRYQELSLAEIARHLRDPPLSESTVGSYVLQAIVLERIEYDMDKVRKVLMGMPEALRRGKWKSLAEKVGAK